MMKCQENENLENEVVEEYDYTNEEPLEEEDEYEEQENDYCD